MPLSSHQMAEIQRALQSGNKIEAIKIYRAITHAKLDEARNFVEILSVGGDTQEDDAVNMSQLETKHAFPQAVQLSNIAGSNANSNMAGNGMADRIIPLNCPACGSPSNEGLREHSFGGEIKCKHCGVTSVLVINNQWHQKKAGEYVCGACGRVARDGDRFCECSRSLLRKCIRCSTEFFIGKNICPQCGENHAVDMTESGQTDIAVKTEKFVRARQFAQAAPALRSLLTSIKMSRRISPKAEAVLRELIFASIENGNASNSFLEEWSRIRWAAEGVGGIDAWLRSIQNLESRLVTLDNEIETTKASKTSATATPYYVGMAVGGILFLTAFSAMEIGPRLVVTVISYFVVGGISSIVERGWHQSEKLSKIRGLVAKKEQLNAEMESTKRLRA